MELTRSAIHAFATHVSKLKPEIMGANNKTLERKLQYQPNPYMDTAKFLYRLATIYATNNNAFIAPLYSNDLSTITGYYPLLPQRCDIVEADGEPYLRYTFGTGQRAAIELSKAGILTQYQYKNDFFGEDNTPLLPTLQLLYAQQQGIVEGIKNSATIRFLARLANVLKPEAISDERERFAEDNLSVDNTSGVMMFDGKYADVKQIDSKPFIIDADQMKLIKDNVYGYFGANEKILTNSFTEDEWNAYYEGKIEPFAIQLSLVMTNMTFNAHEIACGNEIIFTANRLQYASNKTKIDIVTQLFDRGFITHNQGLEIFNMASVDGGDKRFIRREYGEVDSITDISEDDTNDQQG